MTYACLSWIQSLAEVWDMPAFLEFKVWLKFCPRSCGTVCNIMLYCAAIYWESELEQCPECPTKINICSKLRHISCPQHPNPFLMQHTHPGVAYEMMEFDSCYISEVFNEIQSIINREIWFWHEEIDQKLHKIFVFVFLHLFGANNNAMGVC